MTSAPTNRPTLSPPVSGRRLLGGFLCLALAMLAFSFLLVYALTDHGSDQARARAVDTPHATRPTGPATAAGADPRPTDQAGPSTSEVPASAECPESAEPLTTATPTDNWTAVSVTGSLTMLHAPGWTIEEQYEGTSAISPSDTPVGVVVVPYLDPALTGGEALEIAGLLLGGYGPDYEVTSIGGTTLAGRPACRGIATSADLDATIEFTVTTDRGGAMLAMIVTLEGSDPQEIAEARATVDSLTWTEVAA
jgi:hypothetical protein